MDDDQTIRSLAREIATYLATRPDAVDTAEGILRWWLPQRRVESTAERVQRALDLLVAEGAVERRELPDGHCVYGRARPERKHSSTCGRPTR